MRCPVQQSDTAEILLDYCSRRLNPDSAAALEAHMQLCAECRRFVDSQRAVWLALDLWEAQPVSPGFDRELYRRLEEERGGWWSSVWAAWRWRIPSCSFRPALSVAAAGVALLAVVLIPPPPTVVETAGISLETEEIESVERTLEDLEMLRQLDAVLPIQQASVRPQGAL